MFVVYYPVNNNIHWHNTNSLLPSTDYSKHAHICHTEVCLELHHVTNTDLRRLKFKLLNKKPLYDDDNYKNECDWQY